MLSGKERRVKKAIQIKNLYEKFTNFKQVILVSLTHVSSKSIGKIRKLLRENNGVLIVGKNTVVRKAINIRMTKPKVGDEDYEWRKEHFDQNDCAGLKVLLPHIRNRVAMIFTEQSVSALKPQIESIIEYSRAKVGQIAPCDVSVPKGNTGLDPSEITFFHALKISTKIEKSKIFMQQDVDLVFKGDVVSDSAAQLLMKLNITPFFYGMNVLAVYDNGQMLDGEIISMTPNDYAQKFCNAMKNLNAISMQTGYHTQASLPSVTLTGFKNILAMCFNLDYQCEAFDAVKNAQSSTVVVAEEKEPEEEQKKSEKVNINAGGMFPTSSDEDSEEESDD